MTTMSARDRAATLFDAFVPLGTEVHPSNPISFPGYLEDLSRAKQETSLDESVIAGVATIGGRDLVAAIFDFEFLGGTMGQQTGTLLEEAMRSALSARRPFVAVISSGGARMQEGMVSLAQMPRTIAASQALATAGIPRISFLANPTTGGVYASFASLTDIIVTETGATIGFAGPRVAKAAGVDLPDGSHTAEAAFAAGLSDLVCDSPGFRDVLSKILEILAPRGEGSAAGQNASSHGITPTERVAAPRKSSASAWKEFELARHPQRPNPRHYLEQISESFFELHGDRAGSDDPAVLAALARIGLHSAIVVAIDKQRPGAAGFRKAIRAIEIGGRLGLPILTIVDTPGADPSYNSEYSGVAGAIANTFGALLTCPTPVVSAVTGEGGSGGALALCCGDRIGIQQHAVFSVIAPESAAAILRREDIPEVAEDLHATASDLVSLGLADDLIDEPEAGAHTDPLKAANQLAAWIAGAFDETPAHPDLRASRFSRS